MECLESRTNKFGFLTGKIMFSIIKSLVHPDSNGNEDLGLEDRFDELEGKIEKLKNAQSFTSKMSLTAQKNGYIKALQDVHNKLAQLDDDVFTMEEVGKILLKLKRSHINMTEKTIESLEQKKDE